MRYKYYINNIEVFPKNAGSEIIVYEKKTTSSVVLTKNVDRTFIFNSEGSFNFKDQESLDIFEDLEFSIKEKCDGSYIDLINLVFSISEGSFNNDRCSFEVKPRNKSDFPIDIPVNLILSPGRVTSSLAQIYVQTFKLADVLLYVSKKSNPKINSVISDFFQINPINISAFALPGISNVWTDIRLASLSDIQVPAPTELARTEFVTFQELLDDLNGLFRVFWFVDDNNNLRIEHEYFFEGIIGMDLTQSKYEKYLIASNQYNFDLSNYPKIEKITILDSGNYAGIRYATFSGSNQNTTQNVFNTKKIRTDYNHIVYDSANSTVDGLFLFANPTALTDNYNLDVSPDFLFKNLHTYNRCNTAAFYESETYEYTTTPTSYARFVNRSGGFQSKSTKPLKIQRDIVIPFCCDDEINSQTQVKTSLSDVFGDGYIDKAQVDLKSRNLRLSLKYKVAHSNYLPSDIPDLDLWLKMDGVHFNGVTGRITQWDDASGNGRHAVQPTSLTDSLGVGALTTPPPYVSFIGSQTTPRWMKIPGFQLFPNKRGTMIILFNSASSDIHHVLSTHNSNPSDDFFDLYFNDAVLKINSGDINVPQLPVFNQGCLSTLIRNEDSKIYGKWNSMDVSEDNNGVVPVFNPMNVANVDIDVNTIILGSNANLTPLEQGVSTEFISVKEIIIYGRALTEVEIDKVELYLANKGNYIINKQLN